MATSCIIYTVINCNSVRFSHVTVFPTLLQFETLQKAVRWRTSVRIGRKHARNRIDTKKQTKKKEVNGINS